MASNQANRDAGIKAQFNPCQHVCHQGRGLNPWVQTCPTCGCGNDKYDAENAARLKEEFIQQMIDFGWTDFRERVEFLESIGR